jgi:hypothetical protein
VKAGHGNKGIYEDLKTTEMKFTRHTVGYKLQYYRRKEDIL